MKPETLFSKPGPALPDTRPPLARGAGRGHYLVRRLKDRAFTGTLALLSIMALSPLLLIMYHIFRKGLAVLDWHFLTALPTPPGEMGDGIANAIVGTLMTVGIAAAAAIPTGVAAGVYLSRSRRGFLSRSTRLAVDVLQGMPSVVVGLVANLWIVRTTGRFSALAGGAALAAMMLPLVVRSTEEVLRMVPAYIEEAALALGAPPYRALMKVVIPCGIPGIVSGILLGVSRVAGETAPLLFTALGSPFMEWSPLKPVDALPKVIFKCATSPYEDEQLVAWGASAVLVLLVLSANIISRLVAKKWKTQF